MSLHDIELEVPEGATKLSLIFNDVISSVGVEWTRQGEVSDLATDSPDTTIDPSNPQIQALIDKAVQERWKEAYDQGYNDAKNGN